MKSNRLFRYQYKLKLVQTQRLSHHNKEYQKVYQAFFFVVLLILGNSFYFIFLVKHTQIYNLKTKQ